MTTFKNELSWSISRDDTFRKCRRMYYFQYYGSWGGWLDEADDRTRKIYMLKQLQTRQMWAGNKVHECIKNVIRKSNKSDIKINVKQIIDKTMERMRHEFRSSKKGRYLKEPKTCALFEHEYKIQLPDSEWKNNANHVIKCLNNFFDSDIFGLICELPDEQLLQVEDFSHFQYDDAKVYVVPDFAFYDEDDIVIYDWKTGKEQTDDHKLQLACYGLYAMQQWNIKLEKIKTVEFYLSTGKQKENRMTDFKLGPIRQYIDNSIKAMKDILDDPQVNIANEDKFEFVENEQVCKYCNFSKVCTR